MLTTCNDILKISHKPMNFEESTYKLSLIELLYILMKGKAIENVSQFGINVKICNKHKVGHLGFGA